MRDAGLSSIRLAEQIGVSRQTVSNWLNQHDFPRPDKLLKLALTLNLPFENLVQQDKLLYPEPIVAFRRMARKVTTDNEINRAKVMGELLRPLVEHLPYSRLVKPAEFIGPIATYEYVQRAVLDLRAELNISSETQIKPAHLIGKFNDLKAIIIPALWGKKESHENALHILLPELSATWIYLNLDSAIPDFMFWMAHEMAHVFTPQLTGSPEGEDFADAFAGAFLFPEQSAAKLYRRIAHQQPAQQMATIKELSMQLVISPYTIYKQLNLYAEKHRHAPFDKLNGAIFGASKNVEKLFPTISEYLFDREKPSAEKFISETSAVFKTPFFETLKQYLIASDEGASYIQRVMNIPLTDAMALHVALTSTQPRQD